MYRAAVCGMAAVREFSPHAWGCTEGAAGEARPDTVFPTRVGMYRTRNDCAGFRHRFPHTRGDVPSPGAWRAIPYVIFPTRVGMYRPRRDWASWWRAFSPHAWGCTDVPPYFLPEGITFSPHAWGCTGEGALRYTYTAVFPTRVGMYRKCARNGNGE